MLPMCWPLPITAFERYMWLDSRSTNPMGYFYKLTCSGTLDREAFLDALKAAVSRHPLLRARLEGDPLSPARWVTSPEPMPFCDIAEENVPMRFPGEELIDLRVENGLRVWVRECRGVVRLCFQFHHACCDGMGANRFLEDLLIDYDHGAGGGEPSWGPILAELLPQRGRLGLNWWRRLARLPVDAWGVVAGGLLFFLPRPTLVVSPQQPAQDEAQIGIVPDFLVRRFSAEQTKQLLTSARTLHVTVNDLLVRDFFWAIAAWNRDHDPDLRKQMVRIMVPIDLRTAGDAAMPAANIVGMVNIDRRMHWRLYRNPHLLLKSINWEIRYLRRLRFGVSANCLTGAVGWLIRLLPRLKDVFYSHKRCLVSAVVSNLGRMFERTPVTGPDGKLVAGGLTIDTIQCAPPHRIQSGLSFVIATYAGELSLVMNYDRRRFTRHAAEQLLRSIARQVERSAGIEVGPEAAR
jgi:hypothetical protein